MGGWGVPVLVEAGDIKSMGSVNERGFLMFFVLFIPSLEVTAFLLFSLSSLISFVTKGRTGPKKKQEEARAVAAPPPQPVREQPPPQPQHAPPQAAVRDRSDSLKRLQKSIENLEKVRRGCLCMLYFGLNLVLFQEKRMLKEACDSANQNVARLEMSQEDSESEVARLREEIKALRGKVSELEKRPAVQR